MLFRADELDFVHGLYVVGNVRVYLLFLGHPFAVFVKVERGGVDLVVGGVVLLLAAPSLGASMPEWQLKCHDAPRGGPDSRVSLLPLGGEKVSCWWPLGRFGCHLG